MKNTGVSRPLDTLGRVVIPKELRTTMGLESGDPVEVFYDEKGQIFLQKFRIRCEFCGQDEDLLELHAKRVCRSCAEELRTQG